MKQVFVVEDDMVFSHLLQSRFEAVTTDYEVRFFKTGEECLRQISKNPDFVVLDYYLNSKDRWAMDGVQILQLIKEYNPAIQVILISGLETDESLKKMTSSDFQGYVSKDDHTFEQLLALMQ